MNDSRFVLSIADEGTDMAISTRMTQRQPLQLIPVALSGQPGHQTTT